MRATENTELLDKLTQAGLLAGEYDVRAATRLEKFVAARLTTASRDIPSFPLSMRVSLDALLDARIQAGAGGKPDFTINDLLIKAAAIALLKVPAVNRSYADDWIVSHHHADIAVAVATQAGLVTPIVRRADQKSVREIAESMRGLAERARASKLLPDEYSGGSFTVSNLGMFGISSFASIINPPHGAILSVGAAEKTITREESGFDETTSMMVTLTCDHRVVDGAAGATWLQAFRQAVEAPQALFSAGYQPADMLVGE